MYDYYTLRHSAYGGVDVLGWTTYGPGSVLEGQARKVWLDNFADQAEAQRTYPLATQWSNQYTHPEPSLCHLPDEDDLYTISRDDWN